MDNKAIVKDKEPIDLKEKGFEKIYRNYLTCPARQC